MSLASIRVMWCIIVLVVVVLLTLARNDDTIEKFATKEVTPPTVDRVHRYLGTELSIVALLMAGGAITIHSGAARAAAGNINEEDEIEPPQRDAEPSKEEPLLVLTDEQGKFVV